MKQVKIIMRAIPKKVWLSNNYTEKDIVIVDCGYLEFQNNEIEDVWNWCNWGCWSYNEHREAKCPIQCKNLLIDHCNSDMAYCLDGVWYNHYDKPHSSYDDCITQMCKCVHNPEWNYNSLWPIPKGCENRIISNSKKVYK